MRARSRNIHLRDGTAIQTPLLVPALSSKGFNNIRVADESLPAPAAYLKVLGGHAFAESLLISAFDIHFQNVLDRPRLSSGFAQSPYAEPQLLIIDSGWYESAVGSGFANGYDESSISGRWTPQLHQETIDSLDVELKAAIVSFDLHGAYDKQIDVAQEFFASRPRFASTVMLKPATPDEFHQVRDLAPCVGRLRAFDIIGITEKELGETVLQRLQTLVELRDLMDEADVNAPIHVFGSLDPLFTPLYFAAGAEIFDGLSWLRYAYSDGVAICRESLQLIERTIEKRMSFAAFDIQSRNLDSIRTQGRDLKIFLAQDEDWNSLARGYILKPIHDALKSAIRGSSSGR